MTASIFHIEKTPAFIQRLCELNRVHAPDDDLPLRIVDDAATDAESKAARQKLAAIHKHFPAGEPAAKQAAYLLRAFYGLRPFDEANHRTAWDYLGELLMHNDHSILAQEAEGRTLGNEIWDRIEADAPGGFGADALAERDAVFEYLEEWFRHRIG